MKKTMKTMKITYLTLALLLFLSSLSLWAQAAWEEPVKEGDRWESEGVSAQDYEEAILLYREALELDPDNAAILWRLGRSHLSLGDALPEDHRLEIYEEGREYVERAIEIDPDSPDAHFWYASLLGRIGQTRGVMQSLFMVKPMEEALEKVLELDPDYASAYYVLSMLYMEAPGWPLSIGNKSTSLEYALRSVEMDPDDYDFLYNLAVVYLDNNKEDEAKKTLEDLLAMPEVEEDERKREEVEELLSSL